MYKNFSVKLLVSALLIGPFLSSCAVVTGREEAREYTEDTRITTEVKTAIFRDPDLKMFQIHVETFKSVVQLSGFVSSETQRLRAGKLAHQVAGVTGVKNNIVVK